MEILKNNFRKLFVSKLLQTKSLHSIVDTQILYCDGGYNNLTKPFAWSSVVDYKGNDVISNNLNIINEILKNNFDYDNVKIPHLINKKILDRTIIKIKFTNIIHQNNGAELISMLIALYLANKNKNINTIYCDSSTIINWCNGNCNLKLGQKDKNNNDKLYYIKLLQHQYKIFIKNNNKIIKISGDDNLADLGKHKK